MPVIASVDRVALGYEGRLYVGGTPFHQSMTDVTVTHDLTTASARPIGRSRQTIVHLAESNTVDIDGFQIDQDTDTETLRRDWTTPNNEQVVVYGEAGMQVGNRVTFLPVIGRNFVRPDRRDDLQTVSLSGVQSGRGMAHLPLASPTLRGGIDVYTRDFARSATSADGMQAHTLTSTTGATDHYFVLFSTGASAPIPSDATHVGLIAGLTGITGFQGFSPTASRWRAGLVHNVRSDAIKPLTPWQPLGLTPTFAVCVADITARTTGEFYGFQVELRTSGSGTAPTRYTVELRGSIAHIHA